MTPFRQVFKYARVVLPVIHVETTEQAVRNAAIARDAGADGVFLINHRVKDTVLLEIHEQVVDSQPGWWVGVNCLGWSPEKVFAMVSPRVGGVWHDSAGIDESQEDQPYAAGVLAVRPPGCLYFGGVAFKYQREVRHLEAAGRIAAKFMDVVTTSGPGTGRAADVDKLKRLKAAVGVTPLAVASGVTPENVGDYLPHVDCYLVATGISKSEADLDPPKVAELVRRCR